MYLLYFCSKFSDKTSRITSMARSGWVRSGERRGEKERGVEERGGGGGESRREEASDCWGPFRASGDQGLFGASGCRSPFRALVYQGLGLSSLRGTGPLWGLGGSGPVARGPGGQLPGGL